MIGLTAATQDLLERGEAVFRDLLWIGARRRDTGALAERGWWSGAGNVSLQVIDAANVVRNRLYIGQGDMVAIGDVPRVIGLTAQSVTVRLSIMAQSTEEAIREWNPKRAPVEIHRAILDPDSMTQTQPAVRRFVGFVDEVTVRTPEEGGEGYIEMSCASLSQELQRSSAAKRSDADQRLRDLDDSFLALAAAMGRRKVRWGDGDMR